MPTQSNTRPYSVTVKHGFIFVDGVKICGIDVESRCLIFYDRNRQRSQRRGSKQLRVDVMDLVRAFFLPVQRK